MTETYEQLRDSAPGEAGAAWKAADREESNLRTLYRELKADPRLTEEGKGEQAWQEYQAAKDKIAEGKARARDLLLTQARGAERQSIPFPDGEGPITKDTDKVILSQNEANRIVRKLDRLGSQEGPFRHDRTAVLRKEYEKGLEVGGTHGGSICRGVLSSCDELGIDVHSVVDSFRKDRHRESLERSQRAAQLTELIGTNVPQPPFRRPYITHASTADSSADEEGNLPPRRNPFQKRPTLPSKGVPQTKHASRHW